MPIDPSINTDFPPFNKGLIYRVRKSYTDEAEANRHHEILKKLIDAGFIDVIDTGITAKEK
jgi:hypothetical protein